MVSIIIGLYIIWLGTLAVDGSIDNETYRVTAWYPEPSLNSSMVPLASTSVAPGEGSILLYLVYGPSYDYPFQSPERYRDRLNSYVVNGLRNTLNNRLILSLVPRTYDEIHYMSGSLFQTSIENGSAP